MTDEYRPTVTKIKVERLRPWIDKRLTVLLDGLEDEILWDMVFNFLANAQKRSRKEGPEVNPTGGLDRKVLKEAIVGFLGQAKSNLFVSELFAKLKEAEEHGEEEQVLDIISSVKNRPEQTLSDRVNREVRHAHRERERERSRERYDRHLDRSHERYDRHRDRYEDRDRDRYRYERRDDRYDERRDNRYEERRRDRYHDRYDERHYNDRHDGRFERNHKHQERQSRNDRSEYSVSPIPIRRQMSPGLERQREPSWESETGPVVPNAPVVSTTIPSSLEAALRERALKSKNKDSN